MLVNIGYYDRFLFKLPCSNARLVTSRYSR